MASALASVPGMRGRPRSVHAFRGFPQINTTASSTLIWRTFEELWLLFLGRSLWHTHCRHAFVVSDEWFCKSSGIFSQQIKRGQFWPLQQHARSSRRRCPLIRFQHQKIGSASYIGFFDPNVRVIDGIPSDGQENKWSVVR